MSGLVRLTLLVVCCFLFAILVRGNQIEEELEGHVMAAANCTVWEGTVFVNSSVNIPQGECLSILENSNIVFHTTSNSTTDAIIITVRGNIVFGKSITFQSLSFFSGNAPEGASSTDNWGIDITAEAEQTFLAMTTSTFLKQDKYSSTATLTFGKPIRTALLGLNFSGGSNAIMFSSTNTSNITDSTFRFAVYNTTFSNIVSGLDTNNFVGSFASIMFTSCSFIDVDYAINNIATDPDTQGVVLMGTSFKNTRQALISNTKVWISDSTLENFRVGLRASSITIEKVTFDNTQYGDNAAIALVNSDNFQKASYVVQHSKFIGIKGVVISSDSSLERFLFKYNLVTNCRTHTELKQFSMIYTQYSSNNIYFSYNQILNNEYPEQDIVSFSYLQEFFSFYNNVLRGNIARYVLSLQSVLSSSQFSINSNIFDNYTPGTSKTVYTHREIYYAGLMSTAMDANFNYWGTNVNMTKGFSTKEMNQVITQKLYPSNAFKFVPYFITDDVSNTNSSNLGGFITAVSSSKPHNDGIPDEELALIIGGSVGGTMFLIFVIVGIVGVVFFIKNRNTKRYQLV